MEKSKFQSIVNELLEPALRRTLTTPKCQRKADYQPDADSLRLQPRGQLNPCVDCGVLVKNRVVQYAVYELSTNPHWKKKCMECGKKTAFPPGTGLPK